MWKAGGQKVEAETWAEAEVLWDTNEIFLGNGESDEEWRNKEKPLNRVEA